MAPLPKLDDDQNIPQYDGNVTLDLSCLSESERLDGQSLSDDNCTTPQSIPVIITPRQPVPVQSGRLSANTVIRQNSKKVVTATQLPLVINLNPRSVYNKKDEFRTMMKQLEVDLCTMSESWDRDNLCLEDIIQMEGYEIIKNVLQRRGKGGKPALIINKEKYHIKKLCPTVLTVPPTVEATWALLTPKIQVNSEVKHIAVASIYYAKRTKRKDFVDHICEAYNVLSAKYGQGLHFIISGDFNRLNINPILNMSPSLKQVVSIPTRTNPEATLDKIITTLSKFYLPPTTLPPLDNDVEGNGKPSDHLIVEWRPINQNVNRKPNYKVITFRPLPESGMLQFKQWLETETWQSLYLKETAHGKADLLQRTLLAKMEEFLPQKTLKLNEDDMQWVTSEVKRFDRLLKREYRKHKRSSKWKRLNEKYIQICEKAKSDYCENIVTDLKTSNPSQWYSKVKRMSSYSQQKDVDAEVQDLVGQSVPVQAEKIADQFAEISNLYSPLKSENINLEEICDERPPPRD